MPRHATSRADRARPWLTAGAWLGAVSVWILLGTGLQPEMDKIGRRPASHAVDLVPIWCRARALVVGTEACSPTVMAGIFGSRAPPPGTPARTTDSPYYYPPTTALLFAPAAPIPFNAFAPGFRLASMAGLAGVALLVTFARPARHGALSFAAAGGIAALLLSTRISRGSLVAGQTGPLLAFLSALAWWAVGRDRARLAGSVAAIGIGMKLFPALLVPAMVRHRGFLAFGAATLGALALVLLHPHADAPLAFLSGAAEFVDRPPRDAWLANEPVWVLRLWTGRFIALGIPTALALAWTLLRTRPTAVTAATIGVLFAWGGTVMAGSPQTHEAMVLLPAVAWVLAWPFHRGPVLLSVVTSIALGVALAWFGVTSRFVAPNTLHWVPIGYLVWFGCLVRWAWEMYATMPAAPVRDSNGHPGA